MRESAGQRNIACLIACTDRASTQTSKRASHWLTFEKKGVHLRCTLFREYSLKHVGIKQARQDLPELIDRAEGGEEIIITRQGRAVAKLVPAPKPRRPLPSLADFRDTIGRDGTPAAHLVRQERDGA